MIWCSGQLMQQRAHKKFLILFSFFVDFHLVFYFACLARNHHFCSLHANSKIVLWLRRIKWFTVYKRRILRKLKLIKVKTKCDSTRVVNMLDALQMWRTIHNKFWDWRCPRQNKKKWWDASHKTSLFTYITSLISSAMNELYKKKAQENN